MRAPGLGVVVVLLSLATGACAVGRPFDADPSGDGHGDDDVYNPEAPIGLASGAFAMGCHDPDGPDGTLCEANEQPYHHVMLSTYDIDPAEVSKWDYYRCVEDGKCTLPARELEALDIIDLADYPVVGVTWAQAAAYCAYMGRRLPTEAEWERAARGDDGRTFPWGEASPDCGRVSYGSCGPPSRVYSKQAGAHPMGTLHMAGNVAEWVADWYDEKAYAERPAGVIDPQGPATGTARVVRGGSYRSDAHQVRTSYRAWALPEQGSSAIGFRCASSGGNAPGVE